MIISQSTIEVELIILDATRTEAEWLKSLINGIPLLPNHVPSISLHNDSQAAIARVKSKTYNEKRRHLTMRHKSISHALSHV